AGAGVLVDSAAVVAAARAVLDRAAIDMIIATRSEDGISVVPRTGAPVHVPAQARAVAEVSGAGDTVIAVLAAARAAGADWAAAADLANRAGGIVVQKPGVTPITAAELRAAA